MVDVAGSLPYGTVERALDHGILEGTVGLARFRRRCEVALGGRTPGSETLRALLFDHGDGFVVAQSELERRLYRLLRAPAVPKVVSQAAFPWRPCSRERVDALIPSWRLIVEADGRRWHCRVQDFERDRRRDQVAVANGYRVLRFTWGQLTESPKDVLSLIRAAGQWTVAA